MNSAYLHNAQEVLEELKALGLFPDCSHLVVDSRELSARDVFVALPGDRFDPRDLADELLAQSKCALVLAEHDAQRAYLSKNVLPVLGLKDMLAELAAGYYQHPSKRLRVLAVTGTNGKTTVTRWLAQALNALGESASVIGTLGYGKPDALRQHGGLTTPDPVSLQRTLFNLAQEGDAWACVEASSIGLHQGRMAHVHIEAALYTNFSRDHLDYHGTMQDYEQAKLLLARWPHLKLAITNAEDEACQRFAQEASRHGANISDFGRVDGASYQIVKAAHTAQGLKVELRLPAAQHVEVSASVVGDFNADNLAVAFAALHQLGFEAQSVAKAMSTVSSAPGRMQQAHAQPLVVVDYAHTPDALEKALASLKPALVNHGAALWVVLGCGGDRDPGKRPLMARVAAALADRVVITSDNPRSEDPQSIASDMLAGLTTAQKSEVHVELDRVQAIRWCLSQAKGHDVVLLAGKGHETTQQIGDQVLPHSDTAVVQAFYRGQP